MMAPKNLNDSTKISSRCTRNSRATLGWNLSKFTLAAIPAAEMLELQNRSEIAAKSQRNRSEIAAKSQRNRSKIAAKSQDPKSQDPKSHRNRSKIAAAEIASKSQQNRIEIAARSRRNRSSRNRLRVNVAEGKS
jgi:hypothetical protein